MVLILCAGVFLLLGSGGIEELMDEQTSTSSDNQSEDPPQSSPSTLRAVQVRKETDKAKRPV